MGYAIGCIGTATEGRTHKPTMSKETRARNIKLVPKARNQNRALAFIEVKHEDGCPAKLMAVKNGQLGHYASAFYFGKVRYLTNADGTRIVLKRPKGR